MICLVVTIDLLMHWGRMYESSCNSSAFPPAGSAQHENDYHGVAHNGAPDDAVPADRPDIVSIGWW
jgi:hypothetical protein